MKKKHRSWQQRAGLAAAYLLLALAAALGWLYSSLPDRVYLEPGQALSLPPLPVGRAAERPWEPERRQHPGRGQLPDHPDAGRLVPHQDHPSRGGRAAQGDGLRHPFGVKMFSEGALIVGFSEIGQASGGTSNPAKAAGLRLGDRVICIGQTRTESNDAVKEALDAAEGQAVEVVYIRSGEQKLTTLTPVWDSASGQWRAGMWVRDSSAGVGTLTFANEELGVFAGLGHPISDSDTGESVALRSGEIVPCEITGCSVGTAGSPGELKGHFLSAHAIGTIRINGENGVYGTTRTHFPGQLREVAFAQEVATGPAEIWATTEGGTPRTYRIQIERVSDADPRRNLVIRVTDPTLLSSTGGIVQGMSGSPILQNGRLVGAVTHVLVNDPTRGYGIFAQTMLEQAKNAAEMQRTE